MGEYADMAIEDALNWHIHYLDNPDEIDDPYYFSGGRGRKDRRRKRIPKCHFCGKYPLRIEEFEEGNWHLAEYDENNVLTRHVCKMRTFGVRL